MTAPYERHAQRPGPDVAGSPPRCRAASTIRAASGGLMA